MGRGSQLMQGGAPRTWCRAGGKRLSQRLKRRRRDLGDWHCALKETSSLWNLGVHSSTEPSK